MYTEFNSWIQKTVENNSRRNTEDGGSGMEGSGLPKHIRSYSTSQGIRDMEDLKKDGSGSHVKLGRRRIRKRRRWRQQQRQGNAIQKL